MSSSDLGKHALIDSLSMAFVVLVIALAIIGSFVVTGLRNAQKTEQLTTLCIEKGYHGWSEEDGCRK